MTIKFSEIVNMLETCKSLKETKMPFKLGLILAKNIKALEAEHEFYIEREREFALKYLEIDEETGNLKQIEEGVFKIKEGLEEECRSARIELNNFEADVNLMKIPVALLESMDFTPEELLGIEILIEEE